MGTVLFFAEFKKRYISEFKLATFKTPEKVKENQEVDRNKRKHNSLKTTKTMAYRIEINNPNSTETSKIIYKYRTT